MATSKDSMVKTYTVMYKDGFDFQVGYVTVEPNGHMIPSQSTVRRVLPGAYKDAQKKVKDALDNLVLAQERLQDIYELKVMLGI